MSEEINKIESVDQKFNWLPWIIILCLVLGGLYYLISRQDAPAPEPASTTTEFTYEPDDVVLKEENGVLVAYAKGQQVPYTGFVKTDTGRYLCFNGKVDRSYNGVYPEGDTLWLVYDGRVELENGLVPGRNGEWYNVDYGTVDTAFTGLKENEYGYWYVKEGKVQFDYDGIIKTQVYDYLVRDGKMQDATGVYPVGDGRWVYINKGILQTDYSGVQENSFGRWYISDGFVNFTFSGDVSSDGNKYSVYNGKATLKEAANSSDGISGSGYFVGSDDNDYYSSSSSGRFVGNSSTGLFHKVGGCSAAHGDEFFDYYNQARAAGYRRCPNCPFY